jgi:oxygen-dependent protoporphyrinogen oxidase
MTRRVVIVGGGVAGLAAAYRLKASGGHEVSILEADPVLGGKIRSVDVGGLQLDAGPDSLLARKPWAVELCRELGLGPELVGPSAGAPYVWTEVGLVRFPPGPFGIPAHILELWRWPGMSRVGKLRALGDLVMRARRGEGDEALGKLLRRRLGDQATDALVAPLLGGLFAGDVDRLSVRATFPELAEWERRHGSLMRGARAAAGSARDAPPPPMFLRPRGGMIRLPATLGAALKDEVHLGIRAEAIERQGSGFFVHSVGGDAFAADAVVLAAPAFVASELLRRIAPEAAAGLSRIPHVSTGVVLLVYPEGTNGPLPESSGFVVGLGKLAMTACTLVSRKWPDPAFGERAVIRCFVGGWGAEDLLDQPDQDIVEGVARQLAAMLSLPTRPAAARVVRWPRSMPQYEVGHLELVAAIERSLPPGIVVAGQAYLGPGIADCVRSANQAAGRIGPYLATEPIDLPPAGQVEQEHAR